jgi:hypothetical protein
VENGRWPEKEAGVGAAWRRRRRSEVIAAARAFEWDKEVSTGILPRKWREMELGIDSVQLYLFFLRPSPTLP